MKSLIIAEKPSLARKIIDAIGKSTFNNFNTYYENKNYVVTYAFGHLFQLKDIEAYDKDYDKNKKYKWRLDNLPFIPNSFEFELTKDRKTKNIDEGVKNQFKAIRDLLKRNDIDKVINAGDSDREGEIIIRLILMYAKNKKPVYRLWLPAQTSKAIMKSLNNLELDSNYDNLANEGFARTFIDWSYGVNYTRLASIKSGKLLRVGRVTSPIITAIYERDKEIENFVPERYYSIISETKNPDITLQSKLKFDNEKDANEKCTLYNNAITKVIDKNTEDKEIDAGKLYSLSKLQSVAGTLFKMSPNKLLSIVQSLYEKGLVTYPRTNTEYLAETEKENINELINIIINKLNYPIVFKDNKSIFDSTKIESHSALTPTENLYTNGLTQDELKIYNLIFNRFIAVFCSEPCIVAHSTITIDNTYEKFILSGNIMKSQGWTKFDVNNRKDELLPNLNIGDIIKTDFKPKYKETQPPKHYTVGSLNKFLKNPFKDINKKEVSDDEDYKAILSGAELGTEATRASLIESAINNEYILLKDNTYYITDFGKFYVNTLNSLGINLDKKETVELGIKLKKVFKGELDVTSLIQLVKNDIQKYFNIALNTKINKYYEAASQLCKCPKCNEGIINETYMSYNCDKCDFKLYKKDKYFDAFSKTIDTKIAKELLENKQVHIEDLKSKKTKNTFSGTISADFSDEFPKYNLTIDQNSGEEIGECPKCHSKVYEKSKVFACDKCDFVMYKSDNYLKTFSKTLTKTTAKSFLKDGKAEIKGLKSKKGNKFDAIISVDYSDKYPKYSLEFLNKK